jgi:hypothetical protein
MGRNANLTLPGVLEPAISTRFAANGGVTKHPEDRSLCITLTARIMLETHNIHPLS